MARAIFNTHQSNGACTGVCACNRTHQIDKTDLKQRKNVFRLPVRIIDIAEKEKLASPLETNTRNIFKTNSLK